MKCLGHVLVVYVLIAHNQVSSKPWETSTARYNYGGHITQLSTDTQQIYFPLANKNLSLSDVLLLSSSTERSFRELKSVSRRVRLPKDDSFYEKVLLIQHPVEGRKLTSNNSNKSQMVVNNIKYVDTKNPLNKTFRLKVTNLGNNKFKIKPIVSNSTKTKIKAVSTTRPRTTSKSSSKVFKKRTTLFQKYRPTTTPKPIKRRPTTRVDLQNKNSPKNYTQLKISSNKNRKPVVHKIISKWSDKLNVSQVKQSWYDVPQASPQPEIISYSPQFSISDPPSQNGEITPSAASPVESSLSNPINQFNMDVLPSTSSLGNSGAGSGSPECPTVHISSAMLAPLSKQGCSDISVVLNSHFHQSNSPTQRVPTLENDPEQLPVEAVEEDPLEEIGAPLDTAAAEADPAPAPAADPPAAADPGAGGTGGAGQSGGTGGSGGQPGGGFPSLPGLPEAPMLPEFDLKGMMDFLSWIGGGLAPLFNIFKNPWLYIIPIALFFTLGFFLVMAMFPWWIPALILLAGKDSKSHVTYYKHVHKPVYHPDGWFWNHNTKTWANVHGSHSHKYYHRADSGRSFSSIVPKLIEEFARKYQVFTENTQSWKRRKKNR